MIRISILAGRRQLDRINPLGQLRRRRGLLVVGALLAVATVFGVGTASADPAGPPVNTSPPAISGNPHARELLTADPGSWSGNTSGGFSYQWQRCNGAGASCNPISGATNATYTTNDGDFGSTIVVEVTALDGPTVATSAATAALGYPAPYGGDCSLVPNYGDADTTVFTVTCQNWSDYYQQNPLTYSVQTWSCDGGGGGGNCSLETTTIPTFVPRVEFVVSGFNHAPGGGADRVVMIICQYNGGCTHWTDTAYVADGGSPHSNPASPPTINGDAWLGETLSADPGEWSGDPTFRYQWLRCAWTWPHAWWEMWEMYADCAPIDDETGVAYTVQPSDFGSLIIVEVSATNAIGTRVVSSAATSYVVHAPPTVNTSAPTISGNTNAREILTADPGSWSGKTSGGFSYQWQRCNASGANCNPIAGATNPTYTTNDGDIGATIVVEVTALDGPTVAASAATAALGYPAPYGGTCQAVPLVGDVDSTVFTATCEGWSDYFQQNPLTYTFQWWACDSAAADANCVLDYQTAPTVVSRGEGVLSGFLNIYSGESGYGYGRSAVVICQYLGGCTTWSTPIYPSDDGRPHNNQLAPATISGDAWLGETLSADPGEWSGDPSYSYQWMNCFGVPSYYDGDLWQRHEAVDYLGCTPIAGATGVTYTVQPSDFGTVLLVAVTATNLQGQTTRNAATTSFVVHAPPTNTALPTLNDTGGHPVSGDVLTTDDGSWTGDVFGYSYQWQRCDSDGANCQPILGATNATYTVQASDIGSTIVLDMAATNSDGLSTHASSLPTTSVDPTAPSNTVQPQIDTSSPLVGTQVSATTGTWTGPPVPAAGDFSYRWYRCGDGCTLIGGATASTYTPVEADFGYQLAVVVTASTVGGSVSSNLNNAVLTDPIAHTDVSSSIDSGPDDLADSDSATFAFSSPQEPNVDFECFLDEVDMGPCSSPVSYTDLADGAHSFSVHATDFLGLESGVNTTDPVWEWTIDTTAPAVTFDSAPSSSTDAAIASFSFHADDAAATFECKLDAGTWTACVSPLSYTLTLGGHTFQVRATDVAENVSAPVSVSWTVITANLSGLSVDEGTLAPAFDTDTDAYTVSVPNGTSSFNLTPTVADSHATVTVNGSTVSSGSASAEALQVGANVFTVVVTAADGTTTHSYTVTVTRAASANAALSGLAVTEGALSPAFASGTYAYELNVGDLVTQAHFTLTFADASASASFPAGAIAGGTTAMNLQVGTNVAVFTVTAQDGSTTKTYTVTIVRAQAPIPTVSDPTPEPPAGDPTPELTPSLTVIPARPETSTPRSTKPGALPPVISPEFSTSPTVQLVIAAPAGATRVVISNRPDFADARSFPVAADGLYTWTLLSSGTANGERTVYVSFVTSQGNGGTLTSNVKLDDKAPVVSKPRYVDEAKSGKAGQSRVFLNVPATDPASGMRYIQFAQNKKNPWGWAAYTSRTSVRTNQHFIWIRTADKAGNVSGWQKVVFPKTPVMHKRGY